MNMARSNSSEPRAGSELRQAGVSRAVGARPGNGADASVAGDSATRRSDWQLAKRLIKAQIRYPKSLWGILWPPLLMPLMIMGQSFEPGDYIHWFVTVCVAVVAGLSPVNIGWAVGSLRAMSCATAVIRTSRLVVMLGYGLFVLVIFIVSLRLKTGGNSYQCWMFIALAVALQVGVHIQAWREAAKIEDSGTREERIKNAKLEKSATKKLKTSDDQAGNTVIGTESRFGLVLSSGDLLLDDLILRPYLNGLKWLAPLLILSTYGVIFFSELVKPTAEGGGGWGLFFLTLLVFNSPLLLAAHYHHQVLHWLSLSGSRVQWWRQHVKQLICSLWIGPAVALAGALAHISAMEVRGGQPVIGLTVNTTVVLVLVGLSVQLFITGLASASLIVVNKLRGWLVAVAMLGSYMVIGVSLGVTLSTAGAMAGGFSTLMNSGSKDDVEEQLRDLGWGAVLGFMAIATLLWAFNTWRYRHLDIRDSADLDFTGTSK